MAIAIFATDLHADSNDTSPRDAPLFAELKRFCIDTRAEPEAVKARIEAAGGKFHARGATEWPTSITTASWDHTVGGRSMIVSAGTQYVPPSASRPATYSNACTVSSFTKDDASVAAIRDWIGASESTTDDEVSFYNYEEVGQARVPIGPDGGAHAMAEGRLWSVTIIQNSHGVSVQIFNTRSLPASSPDRSPTRRG